MNNYFDNHPSIDNISNAVFLLIIIVAYVFLLRRKKEMSNADKPVHSDAPTGDT